MHSHFRGDMFCLKLSVWDERAVMCYFYQSTVVMDGEQLVHVQKWDGKETTFVREIKDGKMVMVRLFTVYWSINSTLAVYYTHKLTLDVINLHYIVNFVLETHFWGRGGCAHLWKSISLGIIIRICSSSMGSNRYDVLWCSTESTTCTSFLQNYGLQIFLIILTKNTCHSLWVI